MRKFSRKSSVVERRKRVIKRLEQQLQEGTKGPKGALESKDRDRIVREVETLKSRI